MSQEENIDKTVISGFGDEWQHFNRVDISDYDRIVEDYFRIFPWDCIPPNAEGFDLGCGTGRWAKYISMRVGTLHCIDASIEALRVAQKNLDGIPSVKFHHASVDAIPIPDGSADFGYSLGVLHHVPDTGAGIEACVRKLKPNAPLLIYLYFNFDNKPPWYRWLWSLSEYLRKGISRMPYPARYAVCQTLAFIVYWPLSRLARFVEKFGMNVDSMPLAYYRDKSMYVLRTDALDRFGTRLEQRFTKIEIERMMRSAGLERIIFSDKRPYWVVLGFKA